MMIAYAIAEDGKGNMMMKKETSYSLIHKTGKPSKCNSCVMIVYGKTTNLNGSK